MQMEIETVRLSRFEERESDFSQLQNGLAYADGKSSGLDDGKEKKVFTAENSGNWRHNKKSIKFVVESRKKSIKFVAESRKKVD
jgi:hypothetical protein